MRWLRYVPGLFLLVAIVGGPVAYAQWRDRDIRNFRVVRDGVLYRSAQMSPDGLGRVIHDYGIKTVVSFRYADATKGVTTPPDEWEDNFCARRGVKFVRIQPDVWVANKQGVIPGEVGARQFLALMRNPANHPVLVHCYAGIHRTGQHCALYRMECEGWSNADALTEMRECGYDELTIHNDVRSYLEGYKPGVTLKLRP